MVAKLKDEKLKKNEITITVIATGFPEGIAANVGKSTQSSPIAANANAAESNIASLMRRGGSAEKGKIYNPSPSTEKPVVGKEVKSDMKTDIKVEPKPEVKEDDDWGAIPAFLRRSRLK